MPCHASLNRSCIILGCASYHAYVMVVYYVDFFLVLLLWVSSDNVAFVRIRSTTLVCLLHGLVLLPCGISSKMTKPLKSLLSLLASCSLYCYAAIPTTFYIMPPILLNQASNPPCPSKPLFGYVTTLLSPSYSFVSSIGACSMFGTWILLGYHNISYLINASIYLVKGGRLGLMPGVLFHSCRPSFLISVLCSRILCSLRGWVIMGTP